MSYDKNTKAIDLTAIVSIPMEELWLIPTGQKTMDILAEDDFFYKKRLQLLQELAEKKNKNNEPHNFHLEGRLYRICNLGLRNIMFRDKVMGKKNVPDLELLSAEEYFKQNPSFYKPNNKEERLISCAEYEMANPEYIPVEEGDYRQIKQKLENSKRFIRDLTSCLLNILMHEDFFEFMDQGYTLRVRFIADKFVEDFLESRGINESNRVIPKDLNKNLTRLYDKYFKDKYEIMFILSPWETYPFFGFELTKKVHEEKEEENDE
jgi:hypothetical protein